MGEEWLEDCEYSFENETLPLIAVDLLKNSDSFAKLNELAGAMAKLPKQQCVEFRVLRARANPDSIADPIKLCENCEDFQFIPGVTNLQKYGKKLVLEC